MNEKRTSAILYLKGKLNKANLDIDACKQTIAAQICRMSTMQSDGIRFGYALTALQEELFLYSHLRLKADRLVRIIEAEEENETTCKNTIVLRDGSTVTNKE